MQPPTFTRIFGLDCLRAIAISLVLISHCTFLIFPDAVSAILTFIRLMGAVGVDLFFVLSGYLIGGILLKMMLKKKNSWSQFILFWKRRWLRTLPNYFLVLLLNIVLALVVGIQLPEGIGSYTLFLQNFSSPHPNFFTEAWSLSVEEYAYLLLPFLLFLGAKFNSKMKVKHVFFWVTSGTIVLLTFLKIDFFLNADIVSYKDWSLNFRKVVIYRLDSIYLGFLLVYGMSIFPKFFRRKHNLLFVAGALLFLFMHCLIYLANLLPENALWFYTFVYLQLVIISLGLMFPFFIQLKAGKILNKIIVFISTRSYAMYLVNYSIVLLHFQMFFDVTSFSLLKKTILVGLFLMATLVLSNILYLYFEKPILNYRNRKFPK